MTAKDDTGEQARSVHGGKLPVDEQLLRAQIRGQLFGDSAATVTTIGRYTVQRQLGAGGMGTVFAARDDSLNRTVAIKVVRVLATDADAEHAEQMQARMQHEAQALAQLSHPNVVAVYEVGPFSGGLYIAMEYVAGPTMRQWLDREPRSTAAIVEKFIAAGQGLAAAHRRGIVHRDFKPDNVLLDAEDERPRVADFGLARSDDAAIDADRVDTAPPNNTSPTIQRDRITTHGAAVGTPAYMAPEQLRGERVDAAGDQYSFCVALHEALWGHRPQQPAPDGPDRTVPRRVREAVLRGLAPRPADRFATLDALLERLTVRRASKLPWVVASVGALGLGGWWLSPDRCTVASLSGWPAQRDAIGTRFADAEPAYLADTWPAVANLLDDYAARFQTQATTACRLATQRSPQDQARAQGCLDHRRAEVDHVLDQWVAGDADAIALALSSTVALPAPETCNAASGLAAWPLLTDERDRLARQRAREELRLARRAVAMSKKTAGAGNVAEQLKTGIAAAERAQSTAAALADLATESEALQLLGQLHFAAGDARQAETALSRAAATAERAGDTRARVRALSLQAYVIGQDRARLQQAELVAEQANAALDASDDDPILRAHVLNNLGTVRARARPPKFEAAIDDHRQALALLRHAAGASHPETISAQLNLGATLNRAGHSEEALEQLTTASEGALRIWGEEHPRYATAQRMLGLALLKAGDVDAAQPRLRAALQIHERALGPTHPQVANDLYNTALALRRGDAHAEAIALLERGLSIREQTQGPEHAELVPWLVLLGRSAIATQHNDDARRWLGRAIALCELDGAAPREFAKIRVLLARATAAHDPTRARLLAEQAREFYARSPDEHRARLTAVQTLLTELPP